MRNKKGQFIKGYDKDRGSYKKNHPSYVTENVIKSSRKRFKNNNPMHDKKIKNKWRKIMINKVWNNKERNKKISKLKKGKKFSKLHIENLRKSCIGKKNTESSKIKNSIKQTELMKIPRNRELRRVARQNQILLNGGGPSIGRNETSILDALEMEFEEKIYRQFSILGYWVDGYITDKNLVIEVDERKKNNTRDITRQKQIEKELNCSFLRLEDF